MGDNRIQWTLDDKHTMYISTDQNSNFLGEAGDEHEALR